MHTRTVLMCAGLVVRVISMLTNGRNTITPAAVCLLCSRLGVRCSRRITTNTCRHGRLHHSHGKAVRELATKLMRTIVASFRKKHARATLCALVVMPWQCMLLHASTLSGDLRFT